MDEAAEAAELFDAVRDIARDGSLGCVEVEGSGAGVRGAGSTDLLLILFFEVDTGIMEVEAPGSRDLPGVWNTCAVDLGLIGEEGLDFAWELAVGLAKLIDFRGFGVIGVDEDAENSRPWYQLRIQETTSSEQYIYLCAYHPSPRPPFPSLSLRHLRSV